MNKWTDNISLCRACMTWGWGIRSDGSVYLRDILTEKEAESKFRENFMQFNIGWSVKASLRGCYLNKDPQPIKIKT